MKKREKGSALRKAAALLRQTCEEHGVSVEKLQTGSKARQINSCRQDAVDALLVGTPLTQQDIGTLVGLKGRVRSYPRNTNNKVSV